MICKKCGKTIKDEARFCQYCGERVDTSAPSDEDRKPEDRQTESWRPEENPIESKKIEEKQQKKTSAQTKTAGTSLPASSDRSKSTLKSAGEKWDLRNMLLAAAGGILVVVTVSVGGFIKTAFSDTAKREKEPKQAVESQMEKVAEKPLDEERTDKEVLATNGEETGKTDISSSHENSRKSGQKVETIEEDGDLPEEGSDLSGAGRDLAEEEDSQEEEADLSAGENNLDKENPEADSDSPGDGNAAEKETEEAGPYVLPDSDSRYLTMADLAGFSREDCRLARNELYARHGRRFDDLGLQAYFDGCDWYVGTVSPKDFRESVLNGYEVANRDLIIQYEKNMGYQ